jgi:hypothetical protein
MDAKNVTAGVLTMGLGAAFAIPAVGYSIGTLAQMGPGFFPLAVGTLMIGLGLFILLTGLQQSGSIPLPEWRSLALISGSVLFFALAIPSLGMVPTVLVTCFIACWADSARSLKSMILIGTSVSVLCWLVFIVALGVTIPAFGEAY